MCPFIEFLTGYRELFSHCTDTRLGVIVIETEIRAGIIRKLEAFPHGVEYLRFHPRTVSPERAASRAAI